MSFKSFFVFVAAMLLLAGCGSGSGKNSNEQSSNSSEQRQGGEDNFQLKMTLKPFLENSVVCEKAMTITLPALKEKKTVESYMTDVLSRNWNLLKTIEASEANSLYTCLKNELMKQQYGETNEKIK